MTETHHWAVSRALSVLRALRVLRVLVGLRVLIRLRVLGALAVPALALLPGRRPGAGAAAPGRQHINTWKTQLNNIETQTKSATMLQKGSLVEAGSHST